MSREELRVINIVTILARSLMYSNSYWEKILF